ncbi:MAG: chemotaxis protein methyltransferase CheR [Acidobacteriota bacterium]|nr:chemotaxis protein methyltransferase CheR [Acidobacteriota bacterium]MDT7781473.1 chemotaxis protein methyltransferase CheR [Acidobacteriota bacterium]
MPESSLQAEAFQLEDIEIKLLLEGVFQHYGIDFRNYAPASLKRRIRECLIDEEVMTISGLQAKILHDPRCLKRFLLKLSINVTSMFRDPEFYLAFRTKVVPLLRTYPFVRIWHAGCSTGEEVYSMAILLQEEGLYRKCRIYATDINQDVLKKAREGIFPLAAMQEYTINYMKAGGKSFFSDYYTAQYDHVIFNSSLKANLIFSEHNLVTDGSFNEFHVVMCRNVMIYFNKTLQARVHDLIYESLSIFGVLGVGNKESLRFTTREAFYDELDREHRLYRKVR